MQVSLKWLNELVDLTGIEVEQIAHELTMSGLEVEEIEEVKAKFTNIITAQIKEIKQHPNADKLHLVDVDLGTCIKTVVCGAQNIKEGQIILFEKQDRVIVHRVVEIVNIDSEIRYYTKGDANEKNDEGFIVKSNIIGLAKFKIPYVGYPSIWIRDIFSNN